MLLDLWCPVLLEIARRTGALAEFSAYGPIVVLVSFADDEVCVAFGHYIDGEAKRSFQDYAEIWIIRVSATRLRIYGHSLTDVIDFYERIQRPGSFKTIE